MSSQLNTQVSSQAMASSTSILGRLMTAVPGVITYEIRRAMTPWRMLLWGAMLVIPVALLITVATLTRERSIPGDETDFVFSMLLYFLIPEVQTLLGMLLLASPIVNSELESQTWVYSLVRFAGRRSLLLGKYIVAVLWTTTCGICTATIAIPFLPLQNPLGVWGTLCVLCILSSLAHGALFMLIGVLFQKRVMVIAFVYAIGVEGVLGWIPAVINQFTIAYRLRSILFRWLDLSVSRVTRQQDADQFVRNGLVADDPSGWTQVGLTFVITAALLGAALLLVERLQASFQSEL